MYSLNLDTKSQALVDSYIDSYHLIWNGILLVYDMEKDVARGIVPDRSLKAFIGRYKRLRNELGLLKDLPRCIWLPIVKRVGGLVTAEGILPNRVKPRNSFKLKGPAWVDVVTEGVRFPGTELIVSAVPSLYVSSGVIGYRVKRKAGKYYLYWLKQKTKRY